MTRKRGADQSKILFGHLTEWSRNHQVEEDPYVVGLAGALNRKKNLPLWADIDPLEMLPHPEGLAGSRRLSYSRYISIARNILVFTPVAITWEAVSKATSAFEEFVKNNNSATVNFLEFWQNGYGILPEFWTISTVARLDFLIVGAVIILSVLASSLNERGRFLRLADRERIEQERTALALALKIYLFSKREVTPITLNQSLTSAIQDLTNATSAISELTRKLDKSVKDFPYDTPLRREFKDFFKKLNTSIDKLNSK